MPKPPVIARLPSTTTILRWLRASGSGSGPPIVPAHLAARLLQPLLQGVVELQRPEGIQQDPAGDRRGRRACSASPTRREGWSSPRQMYVTT